MLDAMFGSKYGPFAETITLASALFAAFSFFLLKMIGRVSNWTWLIHDSPPFMVTAGARAGAVALIAASFIFIDKSNYKWFAWGAVACGALVIFLIYRLNRVRLGHICKVQILKPDGKPARTIFGREKCVQIVIGDVFNMTPAAATAFRNLTGVSLCKFVSGYGRNGVNDPEAIWSKVDLAKISNAMTMSLMGIMLFAVLALYLAALSLEIHLRP
jgi:hypothetical protein